MYLLTLFRFNPIQVRRGDRKALYQFFPFIFYKLWNTPPPCKKNLTYSFNLLLSHWYNISRPYLVPVANHWTWTKCTPQKIWFFWSNPYKIEVMITSLIERLELPNLGTWPHLQYNLIHMIKCLCWRHGEKLWRHQFYFKITFILKRPTATNFAAIIKIAIMIIKIALKVAENVNKYFTQISPNLAKNIGKSTKSFNEYIKKHDILRNMTLPSQKK